MKPTVNEAAESDLAEQARPGHGIPSQDPDPAAQFPRDPADAEREVQSMCRGGGAVAGVATGATIGAVVAGPTGLVVGAALGGRRRRTRWRCRRCRLFPAPAIAWRPMTAGASAARYISRHGGRDRAH